jgi:predicted RNA binding protein YcfA (HicA-like mRNA interferase family)
MKNITGKKLCKILEDNGWTLVRISGSHHVYTKDGEEARIVVPVHGNKKIKIGLLKAILKTAGLLSLFFTLTNL